MFVVPLAHIFPNIVLGLENSGCPCGYREAQSYVLRNPGACGHWESLSCQEDLLRTKAMIQNGQGRGSASQILRGWGPPWLSAQLRLNWWDDHLAFYPFLGPLKRKSLLHWNAFLNNCSALLSTFGSGMCSTLMEHLGTRYSQRGKGVGIVGR